MTPVVTADPAAAVATADPAAAVVTADPAAAVATADPVAAVATGQRRPALSPSRASDFKQCPLKYRLRAIDRIPEQPSPAALRGTMVHAALEALFALPPAGRTPEAARELVTPAWQRLLAQAPELGAVLDQPGLDELVEQARALVVDYFALEDPTSLEPEACESRVEIELGDGTLLRGFVDRIDVAPDGALHVVDYKTGRVPSEMRETIALFQMKFYALVILRTRGFVPKQLRLLYLADRQVLTYEPDADALLRFERTLAAMWRAIRTAGQTGDFRPNPSRSCSWCDYRSLCPAFGGTPPVYPGWPSADETPVALVDDD